MSNIIDYEVEVSSDILGIEAEVYERIKLGWELVGGITIGNDGKFYQAMIRKSGEKE